MQVLQDIIVIELASVLAGPSVGQFLAELGAKVYKVEHPTQGDITRQWKTENEVEEQDISAYFSTVNWGKTPLPLNLKSPNDLTTLYQHIKKADIVIASFKPGDAQKLKVDYETLRQIKPDLIFAEISGFGGEHARVGYDAVIQAESGFMSINGAPKAEALKMPVALMDILAAHHLKEGILSAYIHKLKTGQGNFVSVALIDAGLVSLANQGNNYLMTGKVPKAQGNEHPNIYPYGSIFYCRNNKGILIAIGSDRQFVKLCRVIGAEKLTKDEKYITNTARVQNRNSLRIFLKETFEKHESTFLEKKFLKENIPFGIVRNVKEAFVHYKERDLVIQKGNLSGLKQKAFKMAEGNNINKLKEPYSLKQEFDEPK